MTSRTETAVARILAACVVGWLLIPTAILYAGCLLFEAADWLRAQRKRWGW